MTTEAAPARDTSKPVPANEKKRAVGYANWRIPGDKDTPTNVDNILKSTKGFPIFDNEFSTPADKELIAIAERNGGEAIFMVEMRVRVATEKADIDTSRLKLL